MTLRAGSLGLHSGMRSVCHVVAWVAIVAAAGGCSDKPGEVQSALEADASTDGSVVHCQTDPRVDMYTANLKKPGLHEVLTFTLIESNPAPPARGTNVMKLKVTR